MLKGLCFILMLQFMRFSNTVLLLDDVGPAEASGGREVLRGWQRAAKNPPQCSFVCS